MSSNPALRVTLGDLHGPFAAACKKSGCTVPRGLARLIKSALAGGELPPSRQTPQSSVTFDSGAQRAAFAALAADAGLPLGALLRSLVSQALEQERLLSEEPSPPPQSSTPEDAFESSASRLELRLTESELTHLRQQVTTGGFKNVQDLVVKVIRAHLTQGVLIGKESARALGEQNLQLLRMSHDLKALARGPALLGSETSEHLQKTARAVDAQVQATSALISQARSRWLLKTPAQRGAP